jgi:single-stranded-DNA-specific exonuclease
VAWGGRSVRPSSYRELSMHDGTWTLKRCDGEAAAALAEALGISLTTASVLVRRGYEDADAASRFLAGALPAHDPFLLGQMREACDTIRAAIAAGKRICVHGDYDVDGICATALAVLVLRELGADVEWHLPSRFEEGYGVARQTLARLADEGCGLVLTVDCGITAVDEVAEARAAGLDVVVTDHHRPGAALPDCPVVSTRPWDYPFPELCGTGVVYKLAEALGVDVSEHLDLVALATIADVVPLVDENRGLALAGLRVLARTQKPGLQALMRSAGVDPATVDSGSVGFRLAPRINAAGRLGHPRAALELLLTDNLDAARLLATQLEELNRERQQVEDRILRAAIAQVDEWPAEQQRRRGYVLADESWHEGVIGIVASRLVERFNRPVVMIARSKEGEWKGSGRSIPAFDLHGALGACSEHLERYGGHRAAAGLSIRPENVEDFARAFAAQAAGLAEEALRPRTHVDAVVPPSSLTLGLCGELKQLAPFGLGNPEVTLLVAGCEIAEPSTVGEGKHLCFRVRDGGRDAGRAIAFGHGSRLDSYRRPGPWDVAFRLQENHWNGTVSPQLVVRRIFETPERYAELRARFAREWRDGRWSPDARAVFEELGLAEGAPWRSLLESEAFRRLLTEEEVVLPQAA